MVENFSSEIFGGSFFYIVLLGLSLEWMSQRFLCRDLLVDFFGFFLVEVFLIFHWHKFLLGDCLVEFFLQCFFG